MVLGVPGRDRGVGQRDIQLREEARVGGQAVALRRRQRRGDAVPVARRRIGAGAVGPEARDLGQIAGRGIAGEVAEDDGKSVVAKGQRQVGEAEGTGRVGGRRQAAA
ncbi:MAG TPA: hypothetical protein PLR37_06745, partial [Candidatus Accumulibacter phosphatis]|nr:hypothetical protein [Candidatus Accumulibacter phosphatis]